MAANSVARQLFSISSAQVLTTPVPPTTTAQTSVVMPITLCQSSQSTRRAPRRLTVPNSSRRCERHVEHRTGNDRDQEHQAHAAEKQFARLAREHIGVEFQDHQHRPGADRAEQLG